MTQEKRSTNHKIRTLYETVLIMVITVGLIILFPSLSTLFYFLPIGYLLVELKLRHRSWSDLGIKRGFLKDLRANWSLFVIVVVILQVVVSVLLKFFWPDLLAQISGRISSLPTGGAIVGTVILIIIGTLIEELTFRSFFQERLGWFIGMLLSILLVSILFALAHITNGNPLLVGADIILVFLDSILYGLIFSRSRNVTVSWFTHMVADIVGFAMILLLFSL